VHPAHRRPAPAFGGVLDARRVAGIGVVGHPGRQRMRTLIDNEQLLTSVWGLTLTRPTEHL
jgi:hypothetical protein